MSAVDVVTGSAILGLASWLLYRSLWRKGGHCGGCSSGGGACGRRGAEGEKLVRLGGARRRDA